MKSLISRWLRRVHSPMGAALLAMLLGVRARAGSFDYGSSGQSENGDTRGADDIITLYVFQDPFTMYAVAARNEAFDFEQTSNGTTPSIEMTPVDPRKAATGNRSLTSEVNAEETEPANRAGNYSVPSDIDHPTEAGPVAGISTLAPVEVAARRAAASKTDAQVDGAAPQDSPADPGVAVDSIGTAADDMDPEPLIPDLWVGIGAAVLALTVAAIIFVSTGPREEEPKISELPPTPPPR